MAKCTKINKLPEAYKEWYDKNNKLLKDAGLKDPAERDMKLLNIWNSKMVPADNTEVMNYIVHPDRGNDTSIRINGKEIQKTRVLAVNKDDNKLTAATTNGVFTFKDGDVESEPNDDGLKASIPLMANIVDMIDYEAMMSDKKAKIEGTYEKQAELVKDPTKAVELLERLYEKDKVNVSKEEKDRLVGILRTITDPLKNFIPDTVVYLNEKADATGGVAIMQGKDAGMYINRTDRAPTSTMQMSAIAAYVHEMIHGATWYAVHQNGAHVAGTMQRLKVMRKLVMKELKPEDLLPEVSIDREADLKDSQEILDYMNSNLEEFLAVALTNEKVFKKLSEIKAYRDPKDEYNSVWEQLLDFVGRMLDKVFMLTRKEDKDIKNDELLMKMMLELAENNNNLIRAQSEGIIDKIFEGKDKLDEIGASFLTKLGDLAKKGKVKGMPQNMSKAKEVAWLIENLWRFAVNPETRDAFEWLLSTHGLKREGIVQTFIRGLRDNDTLQNIVERMGLLSGQIDKRRMDKETDIGVMAVRTFKTRPTDDEFKAITLAGFDVELGGIYEEYGDSKVAEFLTDDKVLANEASRLRKELRSKVETKVGNYYVNRADSLGRYMATHIGDKVQVYNAEMIARMKETGLSDKGTRNPEIIALIDKLATLEGIKYTSKSAKELLANLIKKEPDGMKNMMYLHRSFVEISKKELFAGEKIAHRIKGYNKEIFDDDITVKIAPIADKVMLEKDGFTVHRVLEKSGADSSKKTRAIYINKHHMTQSFNRAAMRMTDLNRKGTSLTDISYGEEGSSKWAKAQRDIMKIRAESQGTVKEIFDGAYKFDGTEGLMPVYNVEGRVIDYRYAMSKAEKAKLLGQDLKAPLVLGRNMASIQDKVESGQFNKELTGIIREDMKENYTKGTDVGKNMKQYVVIDPDSMIKDIRDIYSILPKEVKNDIKANGQIAVRRELLYAYFGFRDPTIVTALGLKLLPKDIKEVVRQAEHWWKSVVQIHKVDIIIRTPAVFIGNIISNLMLTVQAGFRVDKVLKWQWDGFREIRDFQKNVHELIKLKAAEASGNPMGMDLRRIKQLENDIEISPAKDLIDEGLFQAIVEDASIGDLKVSNKLTKKKNELLEKYGAPEWVKSGMDILWITDKTRFFKFMTTATQYSDFIARYAQYSLMLDKMKKEHVKKTGKQPTVEDIGNMKRKGLQVVRDAFINYDLPSSKWTQYANDMGLVMFTKYFERIQKVIRTHGQDKPVTMLMALIGQVYLTGDIDDITDQSIFTKNYSGMFHLDPTEHIMGVITPTFGEYVYEAYKLVK